ANERWQYHNFPVNQMFGVQSSLPDFMVQAHQVNSVDDAHNYIARMRLFPVKFGQVLDGLKHRESIGVLPQRFVIDKVLDQMRDFVDDPPEQHLLYTNLAGKLDSLEGGATAADKAALLA